VNPLDRIREAVDLVEVVSRYVTLKKVGSRYIGLCPFHEDKASPSLSVQPDKQVWYCFGCQAGGNVYHFLTEIEGVKFQDAARMLSEETGISLDGGEPRPTSKFKCQDRARDAVFWWDHMAPSAGMQIEALRRKEKFPPFELNTLYAGLPEPYKLEVHNRRKAFDHLFSCIEKRLSGAEDPATEYVKLMEMVYRD